MTKREQLIHEIEAFCQAKGLSEREFCEVAIGHPKFMGRLRRNMVTSRSAETAELFMVEHATTTSASLRERVDAKRARMRAVSADAQPVAA